MAVRGIPRPCLRSSLPEGEGRPPRLVPGDGVGGGAVFNAVDIAAVGPGIPPVMVSNILFTCSFNCATVSRGSPASAAPLAGSRGKSLRLVTSHEKQTKQAGYPRKESVKPVIYEGPRFPSC